MNHMQNWEFVVWGLAAMLAISSLVRLMIRKRDEVTRELLAQAEAEQRQREAEQSQPEQAPKKRKAA